MKIRCSLGFFESGTYDKNREFVLTTSPSMDILISSNLERLIYLVAGQDSEKTKALMEELKTDGSYTITEDEGTSCGFCSGIRG